MLLQRVVTAIVLIGVFLLANFLPYDGLFAGLVFCLAIVGAWEWSSLGGLSALKHRGVYLLAVITVLFAVYYFKEDVALGIIVFAALWWLFRFSLLLTDKLSNSKENILLSGIWVLVSSSLAMTLLHDISPVILLAGLVWVWGADSFAYFAGKRFGKHKLAPQISPGKSIEGVMGGSFGVLLLALICAPLLDIPITALPMWLMGAALISVISVGGDLYESWMKRNAGVKDSGSLLPGHGGVLDRIDGVLAAMPFYYLLVIWFIRQ